MGDLTKNFSWAEFACKGKNCCGGVSKINPALVQALQAVRDAYGKPLTVSSGYRCPAHNKAAGGVTNSQHALGNAADISDPRQELAKFLLGNLALLEANGLWLENPKATPTWVHLDIKERKNRVFMP